MLYAGDDPEAKSVAASLAQDLGFDPVDLGPLSASRLLEPFALVWITLAIRQKLGTDFALNIVPRASILAKIYVLCALSVALEAQKGLTREEYARCHPGGALGRLARGE